MATLFRLADYRHRQHGVSFDRGELEQLLALYSRRVARGEWKDYAIDHGAGMAVFSVFRRADDRPLFAIAKIGEGQCGKGGYMLLSGCRILKKSARMRDIVAAIDSQPRLVISKT
jgi:hypothetical protein